MTIREMLVDGERRLQQADIPEAKSMRGICLPMLRE